jgi:hypothetical protein
VDGKLGDLSNPILKCCCESVNNYQLALQLGHQLNISNIIELINDSSSFLVTWNSEWNRSWVWLYFMLPETKGKSMEEIKNAFAGKHTEHHEDQMLLTKTNKDTTCLKQPTLITV